MVKNYTYANHILDKYQPKSVVIFNGLLRYDYPDFSGNWYFNYFLDLVSKEKNIPIQHIDIDQKEQRDDYLTNHFSNFEQILRSWVIKTKKMVQSFYSGWTKPTNNGGILVYGSLKHLDNAIVKLKDLGEKITIYDDEYHFRKYGKRFCMQHECLVRNFKTVTSLEDNYYFTNEKAS